MSMMKITRREALLAGGLAALGAAVPGSAEAVPGQMEAAIRNAIGTPTIRNRSCPSVERAPAPFRSGAMVPWNRSCG